MDKYDLGFCLLLVLIASSLMFIFQVAIHKIADEKRLCQKVGGIYLRTYEGLRCVKDNEIIDVRPIKE